MLRTLVFALAIAVSAAGETADKGLTRLDFMVGEWRGASQGQPGQGTVERICSKVLNDRFIECRTTVTYAPQEANPKGEVHVERALFSYDKAAKKPRMRQFHGEGFVNTYVESEGLSFVTVEIENIPAGWRARETFENPSADEWSETFELAKAGGEFKVYSTAKLRRVAATADAPPLWRFDTEG
jgi:hypothetical protein